MSSQPDTRLLSLAPEIVENVIKQVTNRSDLSNVRLVCKTLDKHAMKALFKDVFISPAEECVSTWSSISQDDVIRHIPRHAIIHTQPDVEDTGYGDGEEDDECGEEFENALAALSRFPNLDSVEIGFTPACVGEREKEYGEDVVEDVARRKELLTLIFHAIKARAADDSNRTIRKLTITNLQNCPIPDFTSSDLFRDVMAQLDELHISLTQESNEHGPDHDYTRVELQTFPAHLCKDWLKPISANLKSLSIYHRTDNWGPFPGYFDPNSAALSFPKLENLALGYYTLAHDNDIDWILAIPSLRKLVLHNCMIASWIAIDPDNMSEWAIPTHDWTRMPTDANSWGEQFAYAGTWSANLDRIAASLPHLTDFRFDEGTSYRWPKYGVQHRDACGVRVFPKRYVCFDNGVLPTHWPEAEDDGDMYSWLDDGFPVNKHQVNLEADQRSLDGLMGKLRERREGEAGGR